MSNRLKTFAIIALFGFIIGIIAKLAADYIIPRLSAAISSNGFITEYVIAGIAGAILTIIIIIMWAYLTGKKDRY
ncbi:MAG: hypothetical protein FWD52_05765 [Candidatus Bathyarchaeota archaeon]|nr:hypothetical protein [Candidatus Termiticorpusculum sp.]